MKVLVTHAASVLGRSVAEIIGGKHRLRLLDSEPLETTAEFHRGDIREPQTVFRACDGMDAVVHLCELPPMKPGDWAGEHEAIDLATRGTYNLFKAAVHAEVKRAVFIGTLKVFLKYPAEYAVGESWKPRPDPDDSFQVAKHLGELVAREFSRTEDMLVTCLRVGNPVLEEECEGLDYDPLWTDARDIAYGVDRVLAYPVLQPWRHHRWHVYHVLVDNPRFRFGSGKRTSMLPIFRTTRNFRAWEDRA